MKKQLLFALLLLLAGKFLMAQTTIVQWDFNSASTFTVSANGMAPSPSLGNGTINLTGGVTAMNASGVNPLDGNTSFNKALNTTTYPAQSLSTNRKTAGIVISSSTAGYNSVHLTYYIQHSGTAANTVVVQYLSGNNWQDITAYVVPTAGSFLPQQDINLSGISALNNNANVQIRLVTDFGNSTNYTGTSGSYASGGTIRYDLVTISGNSIGCGTPATQQATGFRLLKTDNSSAQLTLNRGNGSGCLVLCSATGIPSTAPVTGTNYAANSTYGSGPSIGNAFAVYNTQVSNPSTHYFNIIGLTAGTKYYVATYEYSSTGYCYLSPGTVDSFYCNSTILYPGDMQFVGYDNNVVSGGDDAFAITNLKAITQGTSFQIVNSRYEAGAPANTRTQHWYAGSGNPYSDLQTIAILYKGITPLAAGSVLSFDFKGPSGYNIKINGNSSNLFSIISINVITNNSILSGTSAEQFFLTQGRFTSYGTTSANNQYSVLDGHVLHGITYTNDWVDFGQPCSAGSNNTDRVSRLPPDIKCLNLYFPGTSNFAYYQSTAFLHTGTQGFLLGQLANRTNWIYANGSTANDISFIYNSPFTVTPSPAIANWTGAQNTNWFNCNNWENLYVPDSTANVLVPSTTNSAAIDNSNSFAPEYSNVAIARNLNITTGTINLSGTAIDKLLVYDSLNLGNTGTLTTSGASTDTVIVRGSIQSTNANGFVLNTNGWLSLQGNRQIQPINVSLASTTIPVGVNALSLNNPPGINISNGGFESLQKLDFTNGILSPTSATAFHYIGAGCTISSPINYYNEINRGWEKSYIDSKVFVRTSTAFADYTAPLGSKQKGVFVPMVLHPQSGGATYEAGYIGMSHPNTGPADINTPPITKVSTQEYWTLTSNPVNAAANLALYYTPASFVGGQGPDSVALRDLQIVQYWDSNANSIRKWRLPTVPASTFNSGPNVQYGKISMTTGQYATSLNTDDKNFTLGSASVINTLPVQFITWKASLQGSRTQLAWQANEETEIAFYSVEKSTDAKNYHLLKIIYPAGKSYTCYDDSPADGWTYYRLKITDLSGKISYTVVEKVWLKHTAAFAVFPNPATDKVYISLPVVTATGGIIRLYGADGKKYAERIANTAFIQLSIKGIAPGWYLLEYTDSKSQFTQKLFIK